MITPQHVAPPPQIRLHYVCPHAPCPPQIDGDLSKPFWAGAAWSSAFVDIEGAAKPRPPWATRMKMVWDEKALYIGAQLEEPRLWATLTKRDSIIYHDNDFEVFLSPTGDNHRYYELEVNALNTVFDLFLPKPYKDGGDADIPWDFAGLMTAVKLDGTLNTPAKASTGWTVEIAIPWSSLNRHGDDPPPAAPGEGDTWRINFSRVEWDLDVVGEEYRKIPNRPEHNWVWSPQGVVDMHRPEMWGYVQFTKATSSATAPAFKPDEAEAARDALHAVYYAQKTYFTEHKAWAKTMKELALPPMSAAAAKIAPSVKMEPTSEGWTAKVEVASKDWAQTWCIRQDSLVWRDVKP